jgi:hypothetical protein
MKTYGFEIGHDTEVTQGAEASGQALSKLDQTINRLNGAIGSRGFTKATAPSNVVECSVPTRDKGGGD